MISYHIHAPDYVTHNGRQIPTNLVALRELICRLTYTRGSVSQSLIYLHISSRLMLAHQFCPHTFRHVTFIPVILLELTPDFVDEKKFSKSAAEMTRNIVTRREFIFDFRNTNSKEYNLTHLLLSSNPWMLFRIVSGLMHWYLPEMKLKCRMLIHFTSTNRFVVPEIILFYIYNHCSTCQSTLCHCI